MSVRLHAEITAQLNEALLGTRSWQDFVDFYARNAEQEIAALFYHDTSSGTGGVNISTGVTQRVLEQYATQFSGINPWMKAITRADIGRGMTSDELLPRETLTNSEYYNEFLNVHGIETGSGVTIQRNAHRHFMFTVLGSDLDEARNQARAQQLTWLAPQLLRISEFYRRNRINAIGDPITLRLSQMAGVGLILMDLSGQVLTANQRAAEILALGTPLRQTLTGGIAFRSERLSAAFARIQRQIQRRRLAVEAQTGMEGGFEISFVPVGLGEASSSFLGPSIAIVINTDPIRSLAESFGLSRAETRVLAAVAQGKKPKDIALDAGLSVGTIRSQLKAVFAKTGATSQANLVRLVTASRAEAPKLLGTNRD